MSGYTKTYRSIFSHELFAGEVFSKREAWLWMISQAAWKPHKIRAGNSMIELGRGQVLVGSERLAEEWGWGRKKVRNFLNLLANQGMIEKGPVKGRFANIATICNYEKFQESGPVEELERASKGPVKGHTEEGKELKEDKNYTETRKRANIDLKTLSDQMFEAGGPALNRTRGGLESMSDPLDWIELGADLERDILPTVRRLAGRKHPNSIGSWSFFQNAIVEAMQRRRNAVKAFTENHSPQPLPVRPQPQAAPVDFVEYEGFQ